MSSEQYKLLGLGNLKIEQDLLELQKTILWICKDLKQKIQLIKKLNKSLEENP